MAVALRQCWGEGAGQIDRNSGEPVGSVQSLATEIH